MKSFANLLSRSLIVSLTMVAAVTAFSQPVKRTGRITEEEVPAIVRQAFIHDFGSIPPDGNWSILFQVNHDGEKATAQPLSYTFKRGDKSERIEVKYSPEGKLITSKGLKRSDTA